jgi:hypothetical protein
MSTILAGNAPEQIDINTDIDIEPERRTGRRFAVLGAASAIIAGLATLLDSRPAAADCLGSPCCSLASCRRCSYAVSPDRFTCPSGYYRTVWSCRSGSVMYGCGECSTNRNTCWDEDGTFWCSIYFRW